jgi:hypothetical protein
MIGEVDMIRSMEGVSSQFAIFKDGYPEEWNKQVMAFREIDNLMPLKRPVDNTRMFRTLLKDQALSYFELHVRKSVMAEGSEIPENELIELVLRDIGIEYIPKRIIRMQKY